MSSKVAPAGGRLFSLLLAVLLLANPALANAQPADDGPATTPVQQGSAIDPHDDWWTPWYLIDYGLIAAGTTAFVVGQQMTPSTPALIGPAYDPQHPSKLLQYSDISRPYLPEGQGETVPKEWVIAGIGAAGIYLGALEGMDWHDGTGSARQFHDTVIGFLEATALTAGVTNLIKPEVGRLRPDFADRARRYLCATGKARNLDCGGYRNQGLSSDPATADKLFLDGRRSFVSGHSSMSFSTATYTSLVIGGHYIWGAGATPESRAAGVAADSVLMGLATFVAGSRVIDGRHHPSDVIAGGAIGFLFANISYWRRFGPDGKPQSLFEGNDDDVAWQLGPAPNGVGVQLTVVSP